MNYSNILDNEYDLNIKNSLSRKIYKYADSINDNVVVFNLEKLKCDGMDIPEHITELKMTNYNTSSYYNVVDFCCLYSVDAFCVMLSELISQQIKN